MRSISYFALLFIVFASSSLFAVEETERKKADAGELIGSVHKNTDIRKNLKQDTSGTARGVKPKSYKSNPMNVNELNVERAQDIKAERAINKKEPQRDEKKLPIVEKAMSRRSKKSDKDSDNNLPERSKGEGISSLSSMNDKEVDKNLVLLPNTGLDGDVVADLQKDLQVDKRVDIKENKPSKNDWDKLLGEKKEKEESQAEKEKVKKLAENCSRGNQEKPFAKSEKENKQEEKKNLQRWVELDREIIKECYQKNAKSGSIYKRRYDMHNEHLPAAVSIHDYSKQLFYCIKRNNLLCLRAIISKLEKLGLTTQEILKLKNKLGDTPLIYAVKQSDVDIVRFLLLQGADDPKAVNNRLLQYPIDIAIERGRVDVINAIAEMIPNLLERKRIEKKESLEIYNWAAKTKEDKKLQCNKN